MFKHNFTTQDQYAELEVHRLPAAAELRHTAGCGHECEQQRKHTEQGRGSAITSWSPGVTGAKKGVRGCVWPSDPQSQRHDSVTRMQRLHSVTERKLDSSGAVAPARRSSLPILSPLLHFLPNLKSGAIPTAPTESWMGF